MGRLRLRQLILLWLGWAVLVLGFQGLAADRFAPARPDRATPWTAAETGSGHPGQPYLADPFLNRQVAWDSEFYISIALKGYDDPSMRSLAPGSDLGSATLAPHGRQPGWTSLNAAFFPLYPWAMRVVGWALAPLGLTPVGTVVLAGVLISLLGSLGGLIALADLADPGEGARAASHLLVWPASFFLAQVYTEGLFLGLSFGALALARRDRWLWAAVLAALSVWTRSTGVLLLVPLSWMWWRSHGAALVFRRRATRSGIGVRALVAVAAPLIAYLAWRAAWGAKFDFVEGHFFGRGMLWLTLSAESWREAIGHIASGEPAARAYYLVEVWGVIAALAAGLMLLRRDPGLALYGLAILAVAMTSGAAQGMHRYVMSAPGLFLVSARLGRSPVFDRLWMIGNTLAMAVFALAFSWDFWAG